MTTASATATTVSGVRYRVVDLTTPDTAKFLGELNCTHTAIKSESNGLGIGSEVSKDIVKTYLG